MQISVSEATDGEERFTITLYSSAFVYFLNSVIGFSSKWRSPFTIWMEKRYGDLISGISLQWRIQEFSIRLGMMYGDLGEGNIVV